MISELRRQLNHESAGQMEMRIADSLTIASCAGFKKKR